VQLQRSVTTFFFFFFFLLALTTVLLLHGVQWPLGCMQGHEGHAIFFASRGFRWRTGAAATTPVEGTTPAKHSVRGLANGGCRRGVFWQGTSRRRVKVRGGGCVRWRSTGCRRDRRWRAVRRVLATVRRLTTCRCVLRRWSTDPRAVDAIKTVCKWRGKL
jgi:hypothetical protein